MAKNTNLSGNLLTKRKTALTIKETPLSAMIADYLTARRIYNDRLNSGNVQIIKNVPDGKGGWRQYSNWMQLCKKGTPDRFAIVAGKIIFIEIKQKGKTPTADQLARHDELQRAGAIVLTVDSFDDFLAKFKELIN